MIQLNSFIKTFKVSMLRRIITQPNDDVYENISKVDFSKLFSVGDNYVKVFVRDLQSPIWYNSNISRNRIVFF